MTAVKLRNMKNKRKGMNSNIDAGLSPGSLVIMFRTNFRNLYPAVKALREYFSKDGLITVRYCTAGELSEYMNLAEKYLIVDWKRMLRLFYCLSLTKVTCLCKTFTE